MMIKKIFGFIWLGIATFLFLFVMYSMFWHHAWTGYYIEREYLWMYIFWGVMILVFYFSGISYIKNDK